MKIYHQRAIGAMAGAIAGGALGMLSLIVFVLLYKPLHITVGMSHALFLWLWILVSIALGALVGWWMPRWLIAFAARFGKRWSAYLDRTRRRYGSR